MGQRTREEVEEVAAQFMVALRERDYAEVRRLMSKEVDKQVPGDALSAEFQKGVEELRKVSVQRVGEEGLKQFATAPALPRGAGRVTVACTPHSEGALEEAADDKMLKLVWPMVQEEGAWKVDTLAMTRMRIRARNFRRPPGTF